MIQKFLFLYPQFQLLLIWLKQRNILEYHWFSKSYLYQVINNVVANNKSLTYIPTFESAMSANISSLNNDLRHLKIEI